MKIDSNDSAMPYVVGGDVDDRYVSHGLTIRQHFAAMAMAAYIASGKQLSILNTLIAEWAVKDADALIAELNKEK